MTTRGSALATWLVAVAIVVSIFPDVVFGGASLRNARVLRIFQPQPPVSAWLPGDAENKPWHGYRDLGAAAWQLEPAQRFLADAMRRGEGIDWNPYSASGTHGPERLASAQLSVITVATALLGAGPLALHAVLLAAYALAVFSLLWLLQERLGRSLLGAVAASYAFLLVGFHTSMLGSQMVQPYLLAPVLLAALLRLVDSRGEGGPRDGGLRGALPSAIGLLAAVGASVAMLLETFLPTTILTLVSVHALCLAAATGRRDAARRLVLQGAVSALAFLLVAPVWLPILASVELTDWSGYDARDFEAAIPLAALSLLSPDHFWESYGGYRESAWLDAELYELDELSHSRVYHLGVVALFLALQALGGGTTRRSPVVWTACALMVTGTLRLFGLPPMSWVEGMPVFGRISLQYWGLLIAFGLVVLLAYGVDALSADSLRRWPTLAFGVFAAASVAFALGRVGLPPLGHPQRDDLVALAVTCALLVAAAGLLALRPRWRPALVVVLVALAVAELMASMNTMRPRRAALEVAEVPYLAALSERVRPGERVLNIGGRGLYPNWGSALRIPQIDSLDGMNLRWYSELFDRSVGRTEHFLTVRGRLRGLDHVPHLDPDVLDLLGVRHVVVQKRMEAYVSLFESLGWRSVHQSLGMAIYERPGRAGRRAFLADLVEAPGLPSDWGLDDGRVATTTDRAFLAHARASGVESPSAGRGESLGDARIVVSRHESLVVEVRATRPSVLVVADTWHPGWRAEVDGEAAPLARVDAVLRGVAVPAGHHRVTMRYVPLGRRAGWLMALLGIVILVALLAAGRPSRRL